MWNVVAPAGSDALVAAAAEEVMRDYPDIDGADLSELIANRVPGARVGPVVGTDLEIAEVVDEPEEPDREPDVQLWFTDEDKALLETIVSMSSVFETIADLAMTQVEFVLENARNEIAPGIVEVLMLAGGLSEKERKDYDRI